MQILIYVLLFLDHADPLFLSTHIYRKMKSHSPRTYVLAPSLDFGRARGASVGVDPAASCTGKSPGLIRSRGKWKEKEKRRRRRRRIEGGREREAEKSKRIEIRSRKRKKGVEEKRKRKIKRYEARTQASAA